MREVVLETWTTFFSFDGSFIFLIVDFLALAVLPLDLPPLPPFFLDTDFFTFFEAGTDSLAFEPQQMWRTERHGVGDFGPLEPWGEEGEVPARTSGDGTLDRLLAKLDDEAAGSAYNVDLRELVRRARRDAQAEPSGVHEPGVQPS